MERQRNNSSPCTGELDQTKGHVKKLHESRQKLDEEIDMQNPVRDKTRVGFNDNFDQRKDRVVVNLD